MIRRPPRSTQSRSSAASDVYKRQVHDLQPSQGAVWVQLDALGDSPSPPFNESHAGDVATGQPLRRLAVSGAGTGFAQQLLEQVDAGLHLAGAHEEAG